MPLRSDDWGASRLYLFIRPPLDVLDTVAHLPLPALRKPVLRARRHLTLLDLTMPSVPRDGMIAGSIRLIGAHLAGAFHVALDQAVVRADRVLLAASRQPEEMRRCQRRLLDAYRNHGHDLPAREAAPHAHMTLAYDGSGIEPGMRPIDPISWRVAAVELVLSHRGETRHETLAAWPLPEPACIAA